MIQSVDLGFSLMAMRPAPCVALALLISSRPMHNSRSARRLSFGLYDYTAFSAFFAYASSTVVVPVALVALSKDLGFSLAEGGFAAGGALHFGRSVLMVVSMLACGFAAGRWGKRRTFGAAVGLMIIGLALCAVAPVYGALFVALAIAGVGEGTIEGLATPFVQDLHRDEPGRYINFTHGFWSVGVLTTTLASGALLALGVSWRLVIIAVAILAFIPAVALLAPFPRRPEYPEHPEPISGKAVRDRSLEILRTPRFWLFFAAMFVAGGGEFCLTYWSASYIQIHFGSTAWAGGFGTACFAAGMALGRTGWGYLVKQQHLGKVIVVSALAGTAVTLLFPGIRSLPVLYCLLFVSGVATAPFWPSVQSYCADHMSGKDTTMLFILLSCAGIPGCGFFTWLMGYIGNRAGSLGAAFFLVPGCYITLALLIGSHLLANRSMSESERGSCKQVVQG